MVDDVLNMSLHQRALSRASGSCLERRFRLLWVVVGWGLFLQSTSGRQSIGDNGLYLFFLVLNKSSSYAAVMWLPFWNSMWHLATQQRWTPAGSTDGVDFLIAQPAALANYYSIGASRWIGLLGSFYYCDNSDGYHWLWFITSDRGKHVS